MIGNTTTKIQYSSNGVATVYSYPNKIFAASDLKITLIDGFGVLYPFNFTSGFIFTNTTTGLTATVSNVDVDTGSVVTFSAPPTTGWIIDIRSAIPDTQPTSIKNQGQFLPDLHEEAFDRITRELQDLKRLTYYFGIHGPDNENTSWTQLPSAALRANLYLGFDSNGLPIATYGSGPPGSAAVSVTLSTPSIVLPCDQFGNVLDYGSAIGTLSVFLGTANVTSAAALSLGTSTNGVNATITSGGVYHITAIGAFLQGTQTFNAIYAGVTYTATVTIAKSLAGATGAPGTGTSALSIYLSPPSAQVQAYANGTVLSYTPAQGQMYVYSGNSNVTNLCTALTATPDSNTSATINTGANTPIAGQPLGFFEVTNMNASTGTVTISCLYSGAPLSAVFSVSKLNIGYQIVSTLPSSGNALFLGNTVFLTTSYNGNPANILYTYNGTSWVPAVSATNLVGTLTASQISSIGATQITGTLLAAQIASLAASQITGTLTASQIASIAAAQITGQITTTQIGTGAIQTGNIQAGAVTSNQIAANTILAGNISSGTLTSSQIAAGTITGSNIAAGTIQAANIAAATITGSLIAATTIAASNIIGGTITTTQIAAGTITANNIMSGTITSAQIASNTITAGNIAANTITATQLATTGLSASAITTGTLTASVLNLDGTTITASGGVLKVGSIATTNINSNAVSNITFASNTTPSTFGTSLTDLISTGISVTCGGGPMVISWGVFGAYYSGSGSAIVYIYRGSTPLSASLPLTVTAQTTGYTFEDNPGAGTYTYHVYGASFVSATGNYSGAFFTCTELKR